MEGTNFIQDLAIVLLAAGLAGALCKRIGLSVVVGYLFAGMVIGPFTPPFSLVLDVARIETLSQVGLVFLMFAIGLGLSLTKLRQMGFSTLIATGLGAFFVLNLTQLLGLMLGWTSLQSLCIAAMFMVSSSAVIAKIIADLNLSHERPGQLALAITVLEDVVAVVMLAVLGAQGAGASADSEGLGVLLASLSAFVVVLVMVSLFFVPRLLRRLEAKADPELQTIIVAGVLLLLSLLAVKAGYSLALGAFLLGAIVAEMPQRRGVEKAFEGMRDIFSSVFFVAIGMMIDVRLMWDVWPWILGLGVFTLVVRAVSTSVALALIGTPARQARRAGLALTPLGEFTFVIAQLGVSSKILPPPFYPIAVGVSLLTVLVAPLLNRHAEPVLRVLDAIEPSFVRRGLTAYREWLHQLGGFQGGQWWQLSKGRLLQIALEMLFVTGLLIFSERLFRALQASGWVTGLSPGTLKIAFWSSMGLLVLIPLVAIWRNVSTLGLIFAEQASRHTRFSGRVVETALKVISGLGLAYWLSRIVPTDTVSRWAWLVIALVLAVVLAVFSRRLIYWHSEWQTSLSGVFAAKAADEPGTTQPAWIDTSGDWNINVQECVLPERVACAGRTIAELGVRSRYGCSIVEINRHGTTLITPEPSQVLYSGDRLLLLGTAEQIAAAKQALMAETPPGEQPAFDAARLESVRVPAGAHVGKTLAALQITRHSGVLVAGHDRAGVRRINPAAQQTLQEGDALLILGSPAQIRAFKRWLARGDGSSLDPKLEADAPASA
ncbi:MAG: cation:proton antiporter [Opitutaceae bacterium]